ncbi:MAG: M23 family metallopeptidase [Propionibacteriaceae bacterium]|nr:M23 family metallopeptidase [Propionibacteriaceae bacterium]
MGFLKPTQPRRGCDAFGPGALPRRALPTPPAPWRRPLAALVLAGSIGTIGLTTAPAAAAEHQSSQEAATTRSDSHRDTGHCKRQGPDGGSSQNGERPRRAKASSEREGTQETRPRRANTSSSNTYNYSHSSGSSANRSASSSSSADTSSRSSAENTSASSTSITSSASVSDGTAAPLGSGTYRLSAPFGATGSWARYHTGQDFSAATGTPVYAVVSGTVVSGNVGSWAGNYVAIRAADGSATLYAHLDSTDVQVGDQVSAGQKIGEVGSTGRSSGSHLHFEYYPSGVTPGDVYSATNPMSYLSSLGISM